MAILEFDVDKREYFAGIDKVALYKDDNSYVWNGVTDITDSVDVTVEPVFMDGILVAQNGVYGENSITVQCLTLPDILAEFLGEKRSPSKAIRVPDQATSAFDMVYRSRVVDGVSGTERYILNVAYNCWPYLAESLYSTLTDSPSITGYTVTITPLPIMNLGSYRPIGIFRIDSANVSPAAFASLESMFYGSLSTTPQLPQILDIKTYLSTFETIVDNGDGTWTAQGPDWRFNVLNSTTVELDWDSVVFLDANRYTISSIT